MAIDTSDAVELYRRMLRIRLAEERIAGIYPSDKIQSPVHLSIGQEAVSAGICLALRPTDHLHATYRGHGAYIAKGGDLGALFAELYGKESGCTRGRGGSMHLAAPDVGLMCSSAIVASTIPVAVGDALASAMRGRGRVAAALFGDGAIDEGVFFESANFAVLKRLPVVFVLENNGYAIQSKVRERHAHEELWRVAEGLGLAGARRDGDDAGEVFSTMREAVEDVRAGGPPRLIEYTTCRWCEHVGPNIDLDAGYRLPGEKARAEGRDPIRLAEESLRGRRGLPGAELERIREEVRREVEEAVAFAQRSGFPDPRTLCDYTFRAAS
ncbi:MAG: thiamine pyrophosphate-dependent dehydrogenase E1 component subunit alpha [Elusimicrobia bacterium]|nr:thiamine pyrophosphate-dependent dehydrogenase E1 component subunit alpha [Elusimicrobiota bacterium]